MGWGFWGWNQTCPEREEVNAPSVRTSGCGLKKLLPEAVGIDRNDAAKPTERPGRRWCISKPTSRGRPKAVAVVC